MSDVQFKLVSVDYDGQPECKRHVVDAYADLARHNMTVTLNMIMQVIGMAPFKESEIGQAFNDDYRTEMIQLDNIQKVNLQKRLYRHFPFFKRMKLENEHTKSVQFKTLLEVMGDFTRCMDKLRDCYTCKVSEGGKEFFELKRRMGKRLQYLYMNTCQLFKSNEMLDHESNKIISALRIPEYDVQMIKPGDKDYRKTYDLYFDKRKKAGLRYNSGTKYFEKSVVKYVLNPDYQAYMMDGKKGMSDIAIIYFLCLFLDKEVSFELMEKVGLTEQVKFTGEHADKQLLYLKELMCMNRIRMIKTRLDSEMTDTALALDMIGEIRKCPKPLYEVFCKEAREEFKDSATVLWEKERGEEAIKTEENRNDDDEVRRAVEKDTPRSTFVRWNDRFPQLALRYIDLTEMFDDIRFQLRLGTYRFAFYNSNIEVDGIERLRILQKELHGFGRIQEVGEEVKKEGMWDKLFDKKSVEAGLVKKDSDRAGQAPYVTEQRPQYNIDEKSHSIGLRWEGWDNNCRESNNCELKEYHLDKETGLDRKKMFIPYLPANPVIPTDGTRQKNQAEKLLAPQATMSLYDLPGLLFYQYLLHGLDKCQAGKYVETEKYIKDYHRNLWKFFSDMSDGKITPLGKQSVNVKKDEDLWKQRKADLEVLLQEKYQLHVTDIPSKLVGFLCRKGIDYDIKMKESALRRLAEKKDAVEKALKSHKEKVKRIGTKENKFDKMRATIKTGQLAQWLIRDIWSWLPNDSGCLKRLTGQSYVALQSAISMLGQQFQDSDEIALDVKKLRSIFQRAGLVAAPNEPINNDHHPFLVNVFEKCMSDFSVEAFYVQYLICELKHIREVVKVIEKGKDYHKIPFLHCGRQRWKEQDENTMRKLAGRYLDQPIQLPDGMFSSPILRLLSEQYPDKLQEMLNAAQQTSEDRQLARNVSYLIRIYFEHVEKDHSQPFYNTAAIDGEASPYRHVYRIFKKLYGQKISRTNRTTSPAYTIEEIMNLRKKALEDIGRFVDCEIQNWENRQQSKFEYKLREKLQKENDRRYKRREKQLNINEEVKKAIGQEIDNMRQEITRKLERQLAKVYDNERTIRRFKTQDILLFLMAREIQKTKSNEHDFYLKYIMAG